MDETEIESMLYKLIEKRQAVAMQMEQLRQTDASLAHEQLKLGIKLDEVRAKAVETPPPEVEQ